MLTNEQNVHSRLNRHIKARVKGIDTKVDFPTAEAMAFGTLLQDGVDVRISGQDVGRGTFSQRCVVAAAAHGTRRSTAEYCASVC